MAALQNWYTTDRVLLKYLYYISFMVVVVSSLSGIERSTCAKMQCYYTIRESNFKVFLTTGSLTKICLNHHSSIL